MKQNLFNEDLIDVRNSDEIDENNFIDILNKYKPHIKISMEVYYDGILMFQEYIVSNHIIYKGYIININLSKDLFDFMIEKDYNILPDLYDSFNNIDEVANDLEKANLILNNFVLLNKKEQNKNAYCTIRYNFNQNNYIDFTYKLYHGYLDEDYIRCIDCIPIYPFDHDEIISIFKLYFNINETERQPLLKLIYKRPKNRLYEEHYEDELIVLSNNDQIYKLYRLIHKIIINKFMPDLGSHQLFTYSYNDTDEIIQQSNKIISM